MLEADLFDTQRVELINGRVYRTSPQNDPHQFAVGKLNRALGRLVPENEMLLVPGTLRLDAFTVVDPDLMWVAAPYGTPEHERPRPLLLIEVSDTTYKKDSGIKLREYAKAGIRDYWIVNVRDARIEVCRSPLNPTGRLADCGYRHIVHRGPGATVSPLERPDLTLKVDDLLP